MVQTAGEERPEPHHGFDEAEHRLDGVLAQGVVNQWAMRSTAVASAGGASAVAKRSDQWGGCASRSIAFTRALPALSQAVTLALLKSPASPKSGFV
jgi:hypothetical protein